jgi:protein TonB
MSFVTSRVSALNHSYKRGMEIGFIVALLLIIAAFKFAPIRIETNISRQNNSELFIPTLINPSRQASLPPSRPAPPIPEIALSDDEIQDIIFEPSDNFDNVNVTLPPEHRVVQEINEEPVPFYELESYPEPIGGMKSITEKIHYTELARRAGIEGTVTIEAILGKNGDVLEAKVVKGLGAGLDEVALKAIMETKFIPVPIHITSFLSKNISKTVLLQSVACCFGSRR